MKLVDLATRRLHIALRTDGGNQLLVAPLISTKLLRRVGRRVWGQSDSDIHSMRKWVGEAMDAKWEMLGGQDRRDMKHYASSCVTPSELEEG